MLSKIKFILKQLFPCKYKTKYFITDDSSNNTLLKMECTWRMWLGKPFHINHYRL